MSKAERSRVTHHIASVRTRRFSAWSNFAEYGDPNGRGGEWAPYGESNRKFMVFKLDASDKDASAMGEPVLP